VNRISARHAGLRFGGDGKTIGSGPNPVVAVPRDRNGGFEPEIVAERRTGVAGMVISLAACRCDRGDPAC
jgi:hypothetical protein